MPLTLTLEGDKIVYRGVTDFGDVVYKEEMTVEEVKEKFKGRTAAILSILEKEGTMNLYNPETNSYV